MWETYKLSSNLYKSISIFLINPTKLMQHKSELMQLNRNIKKCDLN